MTNEKIKALAELLNIDENEVSEDGELYKTKDHSVYFVLTEEEANEQMSVTVKESLWTFYPEFLSQTTGERLSVVKAYCDLDEDGNSYIEEVINKTIGMENFVNKVVKVDGRGHYLSPYNGEENEMNGFFIYQA